MHVAATRHATHMRPCVRRRQPERCNGQRRLLVSLGTLAHAKSMNECAQEFATDLIPRRHRNVANLLQTSPHVGATICSI
eukprot:5558958-Alexandrium_andersonii.AAC.1